MTPRPRDIVCISSIDWDFIWQGHQEIMSTLAAQGHRVLFVENTGVAPAAGWPGGGRVAAGGRRRFTQADLVFVTSEKLRERAARVSDHVHLFPFGVNFERFERVRHAAEPAPPDLQALARPVVGYLGGLHQWVDQDLIAAVAARMPEATFALVGPAQMDVSTLERCPNVRLLGQRTHDVVPAYGKGFDVGIVPYRVAEYTLNVYP